MLKPSSALMGAGLGQDVALLTDGRFSGGSHGFLIGWALKDQSNVKGILYPKHKQVDRLRWLKMGIGLLFLPTEGLLIWMYQNKIWKNDEELGRSLRLNTIVELCTSTPSNLSNENN